MRTASAREAQPKPAKNGKDDFRPSGTTTPRPSVSCAWLLLLLDPAGGSSRMASVRSKPTITFVTGNAKKLEEVKIALSKGAEVRCARQRGRCAVRHGYASAHMRAF